MVQDFVVYFYRHIRERNIREIYTMYSHTFPHLSERFFKGTTWPTVDVISHLVDDDHIFCLLYKEMYFRHLYASTKPTLSQRVESWENYCDLFGVIINSNLNMQLPNAWIWDMVDEFVYQFQSFCQYRGKVTGKTPEEIDALRRMDGIWDSSAVANYLTELVKCSKIKEELSQPGAVEQLFECDGYHPTQSNVRRMLGYFSLIGLLRVHSVLGDYTAAMQVRRCQAHCSVHVCFNCWGPSPEAWVCGGIGLCRHPPRGGRTAWCRWQGCPWHPFAGP